MAWSTHGSADLVLTSVGPQHAGTYSCRYRTGGPRSLLSELSDRVELRVAGELKPQEEGVAIQVFAPTVLSSRAALSCALPGLTLAGGPRLLGVCVRVCVCRGTVRQGGVWSRAPVGGGGGMFPRGQLTSPRPAEASTRPSLTHQGGRREPPSPPSLLSTWSRKLTQWPTRVLMVSSGSPFSSLPPMPCAAAGSWSSPWEQGEWPPLPDPSQELINVQTAFKTCLWPMVVQVRGAGAPGLGS